MCLSETEISTALASIASARAGSALLRNDRQYARAEVICRPLPGVTMGYIGNIYADGTDDRAWSIFLPHPGRVGTEADRLGRYSTQDRGKLLPLIEALAKGFALGRAQDRGAA